MSENYAPDFIKRVEKTFTSGQMSLRELSDKSEDMFGVPIDYEVMKKWSDGMDWQEKRRKHRTYCPHCNGDITNIIAGTSGIDVNYMYLTLITRLFDEINESQKVDPRKVAEWKNLMKEAGLKADRGNSTGRADLDTVLDEARRTGVL